MVVGPCGVCVPTLTERRPRGCSQECEVFVCQRDPVCVIAVCVCVHVGEGVKMCVALAMSEAPDGWHQMSACVPV